MPIHWFSADKLFPIARWALLSIVCAWLVFVPGAAAATSPCESETVIPDGLEYLRPTCEILWEFYGGLDDPGVLDDADNPNAWGPGTPFADWQGVGINGGRLTTLGLPETGIRGPLSAVLSELDDLTHLNLPGNQLTGPIPGEIGQLTRLEILNLSGNALEGGIPSEIGLLTDLTYLALDTNQLTGPIPPELGDLHKLRVLAIHRNQLSGLLPPELGSLSGLRYLGLGWNRLGGQLPAELGMLTNLEHLLLNSNEFTGPIPEEMGALSKLQILWIGNNKFTGAIPPELAHLVGPASTAAEEANSSESAEDRAFAGDPLGLIAHTEGWRGRTLGTQTWELWFCDVPLGDTTVDQAKVKRLLNTKIAAYFRWLSDGKYDPKFEIVGDIQAEDRDECVWAARSNSRGDALLAVVTDQADGQAYGGGRLMLLSADSVVQAPRRRAPVMMVIAHEMGHALAWPHSFGGNTEFRPPTDSVWNPTDKWTAQVYEYDNPMDLMSGPPTDNANIATIAVNRYAAGWIEPEDVSIHPGGMATYELVAPGESGTQMLVLPLGRTGVFYTLGARLGLGYDIAVPRQGVEVYHINQRAGDGTFNAGLGRRTKPYPPEPPNASTSNRHMTDHVHRVGETFELGRYTVAVTERTSSGFVVTVEGGTVTESDPGPSFEGRFSDDDGSVHEANIEVIAELGITLGCNPPDNDRYCPKQVVKRSQMMAFLARALGEEDGSDATTSRFSDVPDDAWYLSSLERLADLGVVEPYEDGTFRPSEPVTRLDMAVFMSRAFSGIGQVEEPVGVFGDVPADSEYAGAVEGILAAGVTTGCSADPLLYCPDRPVRRDQMASFFARVLEARNAGAVDALN